MTRHRDTEVRELIAEQLELVAGGALMENWKLLFEISNISKTGSEISMTVARNIRA